MSRPNWDEYFLGIAEAVAARSDCERSKVGAVIVNDRRIRATGYNGAPSGLPGCGTCPRRMAGATPGVSDYDTGPTKCVAVHAEANALLFCDRGDLAGASLYVTRKPCYACDKLVAAAGITHVVWPGKPGPDPERVGWVDRLGVTHIYEQQFQRGYTLYDIEKMTHNEVGVPSVGPRKGA